jgi:hypothetical protein
MKVKTNDPAFLRWAQQATAGMDDNNDVMLGILTAGDAGKGTADWYAFALQVGVCLLDDKPLILIAPHGTVIPDHLRAAATVVEFYPAGDMTACRLATKRALEACGRVVRH